MNFEHIHFILELAEHSSISSTAKKLHISQPSLTMVIKKVEEELNVKLFERTYSGIQLTEEGHQALPYLRKLHLTYREMMDALNNKEDKLVIGLSAGILYFVNPIIRNLRTMFHSFQIESFDFQPNLLETLQHRRYDLTVVTYEQYMKLDNKDFVFIPFMECKIIALSRNKFNRDELSIADFHDKSIVIYKQYDIEQYILQTPNLTDQLSGYISTVNGDLIRQSLEEEDFFHITLNTALAFFEPELLKKLNHYSIKELDKTFQYGWLYLKNSPKAPALQSFLMKNFLKTEHPSSDDHYWHL